MKKWIIALSILLGASAIGSGVVLGKIYNQELRTYEQQLAEALNKEALKNVYIDSDVPVKIEVTNGEPRIEFNSTLTGILDKEPQFGLEVREELDKTYITIEAKQTANMTLFLDDIEILTTIYLPNQDINHLSVKSDSYYWIHGGTDLYFNIGDMNINNLEIQGNADGLNLDGSYKSINIDSQYGNIDIDSKTPAEVSIKEANGNINLKGQYTLVDIENHGGRIDMTSDIPSRVVINNYGGTSKLVGKYEDIQIEGEYGDIWVNSESACDIFVSTSGNVELVGALKNVDMRSKYGSVNLMTVIEPQRINLLGEYENISLALPNNIPGFEVTHQKDYEQQESIYTDFDVKRGIQEQTVDKLYFGNGNSKIRLEGSNSKITILEGKGIPTPTSNVSE